MTDIVVYQPDEVTRMDVRADEETVWLSQKQMAALFGCDRVNITQHLKNIFQDGELSEKVVCKDFLHTTQHGAIDGKTQSRTVSHYNLDAIISVGFRVNSKRGIQFRQWATAVIKERLLRGYRPVMARISDKSALYTPQRAEDARCALEQGLCSALATSDLRGVLAFIRREVAERWLKSYNLTVEDARRMAELGLLPCVAPELRRYPSTWRSPLRSSGLMYVADAQAQERLRQREGTVLIIGEDALTRQIGVAEVEQPKLVSRKRGRARYTVADIAFHDAIVTRRALAAR
jgi:hypothetical protein